MVAMQIKAMAHFYRYQTQTRLRRHVRGVQHNITGECAILKYSGTAFFAGARALSGVQEERHYISIRHSRIRYRLICHGNDSVFLRDTCNVCTACALHGRRVEIEAIRPPLGSVVIYSISAVTQNPYNSFRHTLILNWFIYLYFKSAVLSLINVHSSSNVVCALLARRLRRFSWYCKSGNNVIIDN